MLKKCENAYWNFASRFVQFCLVSASCLLLLRGRHWSICGCCMASIVLNIKCGQLVFIYGWMFAVLFPECGQTWKKYIKKRKLKTAWKLKLRQFSALNAQCPFTHAHLALWRHRGRVVGINERVRQMVGHSTVNKCGGNAENYILKKIIDFVFFFWKPFSMDIHSWAQWGFSRSICSSRWWRNPLHPLWFGGGKCWVEVHSGSEFKN